jgi:hypothetical protein
MGGKFSAVSCAASYFAGSTGWQFTGWTCTHWKAPPYHRAHPDLTLPSRALRATIADVMRLLGRELELATVRGFVRRGGVLVVEGRAGMGKTAIVDATCIAAQRVGRLVLRARGSDLESDFAFGIARQLLERWCTDTSSDVRAALFSGPAGAAKALLLPRDSGRNEEDTSFALVHGLYWLVVNLATRRPILLAVDDAHWGDDASLRWLAYLAARLDGIEASLVVSLRPQESRSQGRPLQAVRAAASATVCPNLLSEQAVAAIAQKILGIAVEGDVCASIHRATGGNPFYVLELVRGLKRADHPTGERVIEDAVSRGDLDGVALQLSARLRDSVRRRFALLRRLRFSAMAASFGTRQRSRKRKSLMPSLWRRNWSASMSSVRIGRRGSFIL